MAVKKGALAKIAEVVADAVETVAVNVGLTEPEHKSKAVRKAERKAKVMEVVESKKAGKARRTNL